MPHMRQAAKRFLLSVNHANKHTQLLLSPYVTYQTNDKRGFVSAPVLSQKARNSSKISHSFEEVVIPVPWGNISGKWWGNRNTTPLVGLHGFEDNAGTFDRIAPLLDVPAFLAWDAPGHGKSSKFPKGSSYSFLDFVLSLRQVLLHFGWEKVSILGHSFGSVVGSIYTALYPNEVNYLIRIDDASIVMHLLTKGLSPLKKAFNNNVKLDCRSSEIPPAYSWEELLTGYCNGSNAPNSVSRDYAHFILKRGVTKHPNFEDMYFFSRDPKLRFGDFNRPDISLLEECAQNIKCHVLSIYGTEGFLHIHSQKLSNVPDLYSRQEKFLEKSAASYERHDLPGTHHLHLNNPEPVATLVNRFLSRIEGGSF